MAQFQPKNSQRQHERDDVGADQRRVADRHAVDEPAVPAAKAEVAGSEIACVSLVRTIRIAWGSQQSVVSTAPAVPTTSIKENGIERRVRLADITVPPI
jgi:hypothetical protein